jgi:hypothetical protein
MCQDCVHSLKDSPELCLLIQVAAAELDEQRASRARRLLAAHHETLDWGRFLHQAARHRLLPLVGRNLIKYGVIHDDDRRALTPYRQVFAGAYLGNRARNQAQHAEYAVVLRAIQAADVPFLVRKGPVLDTYVFGDLGARQSSDLDVLLDRTGMAAFTAALEAVGYRQGTLTFDGDVRPYSRRAHVYWSTHLINSLPFVKYSGTFEADHFKVDPCHGIAQPTSAARVPNADLFSRAVTRDVCGVPALTLAESDFLLDLCLHLHKEATSPHYRQIGKGLRIRQLLDIAALTSAWLPEQWDELIDLARECTATSEVHYALYFTSRCYPDSVPEQVLKRLQPQDAEYLEQSGGLDQRHGQGDDPFVELMLRDESAGEPSSAVPRG